MVGQGLRGIHVKIIMMPLYDIVVLEYKHALVSRRFGDLLGFSMV